MENDPNNNPGDIGKEPYRELMDKVNERAALPKDPVELQSHDSAIVNETLDRIESATVLDTIHRDHGLKDVNSSREIAFPYGYTEDLVENAEKIPEIKKMISERSKDGWKLFGVTASAKVSQFKDPACRHWITKERGLYMEWQTLPVSDANVHFQRALSEEEYIHKCSEIIDEILNNGEWTIGDSLDADSKSIHVNDGHDRRILNLGHVAYVMKKIQLNNIRQ